MFRLNQRVQESAFSRSMGIGGRFRGTICGTATVIRDIDGDQNIGHKYVVSLDEGFCDPTGGFISMIVVDKSGIEESE